MEGDDVVQQVKELRAELDGAMKMGGLMKQAIVKFCKEMTKYAMERGDLELAGTVKQTYEALQEEIAKHMEEILAEVDAAKAS